MAGRQSRAVVTQTVNVCRSKLRILGEIEQQIRDTFSASHRDFLRENTEPMCYGLQKCVQKSREMLTINCGVWALK
jgi:hypothetical protein